MSSALDAFTRLQAIVNGEDVEPQTRLEYLVKEGGVSIPEPTAEDEGKVLTAGPDGTASWQTAGGYSRTRTWASWTPTATASSIASANTFLKALRDDYAAGKTAQQIASAICGVSDTMGTWVISASSDTMIKLEARTTFMFPVNGVPTFVSLSRSLTISLNISNNVTVPNITVRDITNNAPLTLADLPDFVPANETIAFYYYQ